MDRNKFIEDLKKRLGKLPYDEVKDALDYYEGYFDDAGVENEQAVLAEFGSPSSVASQIIASYAVKEAGAEGSGKKNWRTSWLVILALFASPIAVPLVIAAGAVALSLVIALSAVVFSFFAAGAAVFISGLACIIVGFLVVIQSVPTALFVAGAGLMLLGIGAAILIATAKLSRICFRWLSKIIGGFILRRKKRLASDAMHTHKVETGKVV